MEESTEKRVRPARKVGISRIFANAYNNAIMQDNDKKTDKSQTKILPIQVTLDSTETQNSDKTPKHQHEPSSAVTETNCRKRFPETATNDRSFKNLDDQGSNAQPNSDRHSIRTADKHHLKFKRSSYSNNSNEHHGSFHKQNSISGHDFDYHNKSNNAKPDSKSHLDNSRQNYVRHNFEIDKHNSDLKQQSSYSDNSMQSGSFHRQSSNSDYHDSKTNNIKHNSKSYPYKHSHQSPYFKQYSDSHDHRWEKSNLHYQSASGQYSDNDDGKLYSNRPNGQNTYFRSHFDSRNKANSNFEKQSSFMRRCSDDPSDKFHKSTGKQISDSSDHSDFPTNKSHTHSFRFRSHSGDQYDDSSNDRNMYNSKSCRNLSKDAQKSSHNSEILTKNLCINHKGQFSQPNEAGRELDYALNCKSQDKDLAVSDAPFDIFCTSDAQDEESINMIEYCGNKNQRTFEYSEKRNECTSSNSRPNIRISLKNDLTELPVLSKTNVPSCTNDVSSSSLLTAVSTNLPVIASTSMAPNSNTSLQICSNESLPISYSLSNGSSWNAFEKICNSISSSPDDFIPPPVMNITVSEENEKSFQEREVKAFTSSTSSESDEYCFSLPDSEHLKAISNFITKVKEKKKVKSAVATDVVRDLNRLFKDHLEGNIIDVYGSYDCDLAITTSDINFVIKTEVPLRKPFMYEVYKVLKNEQSNYHILPYEEGISVHQCKINFSHPATGVSCQLAYLGRYQENVLKMDKFLKRVCSRDPKVKTLILAAKIWAERLRINEVEEGKLHPIGFVLLVIHFLQHCENPILPVYNFCDQVPQTLLPNETSIGELWLSFLRYYSVTFNWQKDVVTVNSKENVSKKSKQWDNYWIAIEDPFSEKNVAEKVVNCDVADHIKACFKSSFEHFMSPPILTSPDDDEEASEFEFSFDQCIADQTDSFCEMCDEFDYVCEDCKKKYYVKPMTTLPKMTDSFLNKVKEALFIIYDKYILSDKDVEERKNFVKDLQKEVCKVYPQAQLNLFGSSTNGFGFKKSDLDICMTFKNEKVMNSKVLLKGLRRILRKDKTRFEYVFAIFDAKIPILKFRYKLKGWLCDISFNNTLAVHNSELLYTYSLIDRRCKILGCALKLMAKKAHIAEVTDKALSSYSYLNMVIHFLQQTEPPVLPILQDSKYWEKNYEHDDIVDDCNVWFCKDLNYIKEAFKSENETPVEQLFLDLLDYYCSFDCSLLISIRQKEIMPLGEKHKGARLFNIQDPFIETKNLGCVVSASKAQETKSVFNRARQLFRTPITELPSGVKDIEDYFFSSMSLTGRIQKEVHCDMCNKFGHEQKDCSHFQFHKNFLNKPFRFQKSYTKRSAVDRKLQRSNLLGKNNKVIW